MSLRLKFVLIMLLAVVTAVLAYPREDDLFRALHLKSKTDQSRTGVKQGLDLQGGAQLVFQADLSKTKPGDRDNALDSLITVINRRANFGGTSEITVQRQGSDKVSVSLPGVKDVNEAIDRIGKTANLEFVEVNQSDGSQTPTGITGKDVDSANADYDPQRAQPVVTLNHRPGRYSSRYWMASRRLGQPGQSRSPTARLYCRATWTCKLPKRSLTKSRRARCRSR
jgi:preprotein translocase subunit SecD